MPYPRDISDNSFWSEIPEENEDKFFSGSMTPSALDNQLNESHAAIKRWYDRENPTVTSTGSGNTYAIEYDLGPTSLANGESFTFIADKTNTAGGTTLNVQGLGAKPVKMGSVALGGGEIVAGRVIRVAYQQSTDSFQLESVPGNYITSNGGTMAGDLTLTSGTVHVDVGQVRATGNINTAGKLCEDDQPLIPTGVIVLWTGALNAIPAGWALCDGTNNTPDLRNRFVVGSGGSYGQYWTGGYDIHSVATEIAGWHDHATTAEGHHSHANHYHALSVAEIPPHNHSIPLYGGSTGSYGTRIMHTNHVTFAGHAWTDNNGSGAAHTHGMDGAGSHTHGIYANGNHQHTINFDNRPSYYALAYIMKL